MTRWWTQTIADIGDVVPIGLLAVLLLLLCVLIGAALYWWPAWTRWRPRLGGSRRRASARPDPEPGPAPDTAPDPAPDTLPDRSAAAFTIAADRLAAQGRYAEAVRERLRAMVRELVDATLIDNRPGWTVTELAAAAGAAYPPVRPPLDIATDLFSGIWYGQRPAGRDHDDRMREQAARLRALLPAARVGGAR